MTDLRQNLGRAEVERAVVATRRGPHADRAADNFLKHPLCIELVLKPHLLGKSHIFQPIKYWCRLKREIVRRSTLLINFSYLRLMRFHTRILLANTNVLVLHGIWVGMELNVIRFFFSSLHILPSIDEMCQNDDDEDREWRTGMSIHEAWDKKFASSQGDQFDCVLQVGQRIWRFIGQTQPEFCC